MSPKACCCCGCETELTATCARAFGPTQETSPENQLYLFQFPRLFPKFKYPPSDDKEAVKPEAEASASGSEGSPGKPRRSVAFAPDTAGGGGATGSQSGLNAEASPTGAAKVKKDPDATGKEEAQTREGPEGQIGQLKVYRDGRVNFHFGDVVMEVSLLPFLLRCGKGSVCSFCMPSCSFSTAGRRRFSIDIPTTSDGPGHEHQTRRLARRAPSEIHRHARAW